MSFRIVYKKRQRSDCTVQLIVFETAHIATIGRLLNVGQHMSLLYRVTCVAESAMYST